MKRAAAVLVVFLCLGLSLAHAGRFHPAQGDVAGVGFGFGPAQGSPAGAAESLNAGWDLTTISADSKTFSVATEAADCYSFYVAQDGSKLFAWSRADRAIHQYTLGTPFDISTASYDSVTLSYLAQTLNGYGGGMSRDGLNAYVVDLNGNDAYWYSLASAWDISSPTYEGTLDLTGGIAPYMCELSWDGDKFYTAGSSASIGFAERTLSTAWDVTSGGAATNFDYTPPSSVALCVRFAEDGTAMYSVSSATSHVHAWSLSSAWDISTATYDGIGASWDYSSVGGCYAAHFVGGKAYLMVDTGKTIHQFSVTEQ